jgi:hypothetical protein
VNNSIGHEALHIITRGHSQHSPKATSLLERPVLALMGCAALPVCGLAASPYWPLKLTNSSAFYIATLPRRRRAPT